MELDVLGLLSACSYALDCVEAELVHVTGRHAKRVAYMSVCTAEQMGILGKELQDLSFSQIKALADFFARIVDYKSPFTSTHSIGVAVDVEMLARHMGFDEETAQKMYLAGALHDIGKVAIGNEILEKPGRLTESRPYKQGMPHEKTYGLLRDMAGKGWIDAVIVEEIDACFGA